MSYGGRTSFTLAVCFVYLMKSDDVCLIVALDVKLMLSWVDFLLCTNHTHIHHRKLWHIFKSLKYGSCSCTAAAVLLL